LNTAPGGLLGTGLGVKPVGWPLAESVAPLAGLLPPVDEAGLLEAGLLLDAVVCAVKPFK